MSSGQAISGSASTAVADPGPRESLRRLLRDTAILYSTESEPIRHRNGAISPWAFYSWSATLTAEGLRLAAQNLLQRLATFESTQLVSYGYTALPLLSACVMLGGGRYTGAAIRDRRKKYLSCRRIEGPYDKSRPVVVIDDSLSSGRSLHNAITAVEDEGGEVEGALSLVHFPFRGGMEWANSHGYRTESLFNIWTDLEMAARPGDSYIPESYEAILRRDHFPDGLKPAILARMVAEEYLRTGSVRSPPQFLDEAYDARGGTFVSFRRRSDDFRYARDGYWHFTPEDAEPARDVVYATIDTLRSSAGSVNIRNFADLKCAVTFFGPLERVSPRQLDFERYGIVVRSRVLPNKQGGALPNTQVFISEIEQYRHARSVNARVDVYEAHDLFRHTIEKSVEPGEEWLPYGLPEDSRTNWWRDLEIGRQLTSRARDLVLNAGNGADANLAGLIPSRIDGVAVKLYHAGGLAGLGLMLDGNLDAALQGAVKQATHEARFIETKHNVTAASLYVSVTVLHHPERLGNASPKEVATKVRRGLDAVGVSASGNTTVLLPSALTYNTWSQEQFVQAALARVGSNGDGCSWTTYQTAEWLNGPRGAQCLRFGFPWRRQGHYDLERARADTRLLASYIFNALGEDGLPCYRLLPITGERQHAGTSARSLHGILTLDSAGKYLGERTWRQVALRGYEYCLAHVADGTLNLPNRSNGLLADCVLLAGIARSGTDMLRHSSVREIAGNLAALFRADGRISPVPKRLSFPDDQDYLPGAVLWAIGEYCRATGAASPVSRKNVEWYCQRFSTVPNWGMAGWQPQGWRAIFDLTRDVEQAQLAYAAADWAVEQQLEKNGAFLEDLSPDEPSFDTAFIAEGIAAAWSIARASGEESRAARYEESWRKAMGFMDALIVRPEDTFAMRAGDRAVGGVRCMQSRSDIRIDQVSHCLSALVTGAELLR